MILCSSADKTVSAFDIEHKVTKKQIKRLRKKLAGESFDSMDDLGVLPGRNLRKDIVVVL